MGLLGLAGGSGENMLERDFITQSNTESKYVRARKLLEVMA